MFMEVNHQLPIYNNIVLKANDFLNVSLPYDDKYDKYFDVT